MGITGLLPFLEKASQKTNINQFNGCTVAIDSYCWLHRGVFSCADKLLMGQQTDAYVNYCMKLIHMLLGYNIKPILVFDGRYLPAKEQTEVKRREARETNRRKAAELMRMGKYAEGRNVLRKAIDITHQIALELIKACQKMNIDCIVAPYEADAQLAYLNINGFADLVVTEDSDLILFGCKKVFFKMDVNGNGTLVDQERLHLAMDVSSEQFNMENFRYMCILSGCDYLPSIPGIGLSKARKFITINTDCDIHRALTRLGSCLKMKSVVVTKEYRDAFILAVITFKHQLVFCPLKKAQVRLNPPPPEVTEEQLYYAGQEVEPDLALQLAYGNCDPFTFKVLHNFDPDKTTNINRNSNTWRQQTLSSKHISIWSTKYELVQSQLQKTSKKDVAWPTSTHKTAILNTSRLRRSLVTEDRVSDYKELDKNEILNMYEQGGDIKDIERNLEVDICSPQKEQTSVLVRTVNPFAKQSSPNKTSPSLLSKCVSRIRGRNIRVRRTIISETIVTESKFFAKPTNKINDDQPYSIDNLSQTSEKENIEENKTEETNDVKLQTEMLTDNTEKNDSYPMDIDEEHNVSVASREYSDTEHLNSSPNSHIRTSNINDQTNELYNRSANESCSLTASMTVSNDTDYDFFIQQGDVDISSLSSFKWSNTRSQMNNKVKSNNNKSYSNRRTALNGKRQSQQLCSPQKQQSLLSMYGFQKKRKLA